MSYLIFFIISVGLFKFFSVFLCNPQVEGRVHGTRSRWGWRHINQGDESAFKILQNKIADVRDGNKQIVKAV